MAYTALYRKWRPAVFEDVKGQDPIVRTLRNQIRTGKTGHAYLFCGSRGTGKTTVARILARAVNCEHPSDGNPCGCCESCKAIERGNSVNVVEVDAASNNNVDYVRSIIDDMQYAPTEGRYRVYIIDEVHMFSASSFNALLKTLEEPPEYVIFILATTDPQKIPATILSRCQQYDFRRIDGQNLIGRLRELCLGEHIDIEDRALEYIARKAEGGMRDAISLLDQAAWGAEGRLTYDDVLRSLGAVDNDVFSRFFRKTAEADAAGLLAIVDEVVMSGRDMTQFTRDYCWYLRNILMVKASSADTAAVDVPDEDRQKLAQEAGMMSLDGLIRLIRIYSAAINDMRNSIGRRVVFEVATIRAIRPEADSNAEALTARVAALEQKLSNISALPAREAAPVAADEPETGYADFEGADYESIDWEAAAPAPVPKPVRPVSVPEKQSPAPAVGSAAPAAVTPQPKVQTAAANTAGGSICEKWDEIFGRVNDPLARVSGRSAVPVKEDGGTTLLFPDRIKLDGARHYNLDKLVLDIADKDFGIHETLTMRIGTPADYSGDAEADARSLFPGLIIEGN